MVSNLYETFGFTLDESSDNGDSVWSLDITSYTNQNNVIKANTESEKSHE